MSDWKKLKVMSMRKFIGSLFIIIIVGYFALPNLIQYLYNTTTDESAIRDNLVKYNKISLELNGLSNQSKSKETLATLDSLHLWLHVRGVSVDEGHNSISTNEKWKEIIAYYSSN